MEVSTTKTVKKFLESKIYRKTGNDSTAPGSDSEKTNKDMCTYLFYDTMVNDNMVSVFEESLYFNSVSY